MCGIAGKVSLRGDVPAALVEAMCERQAHRGPDSRGIHRSKGVALGIQRLRIIDLETGDQPIYNEDRSVAVVLNGEIYNFPELRAELERRGHSFYTQSDTEVIAHLYEERGPDLVEELNGMFAFAVWDERRQRLLLARDRVGKKPLFYAEGDGWLSFASELPALMADPEVRRRSIRPRSTAISPMATSPRPGRSGATSASCVRPTRWSGRTARRRSSATGGSTTRRSAARTAASSRRSCASGSAPPFGAG